MWKIWKMTGRACGEGVGGKHLILFYIFIYFGGKIFIQLEIKQRTQMLGSHCNTNRNQQQRRL